MAVFTDARWRDPIAPGQMNRASTWGITQKASPRAVRSTFHGRARPLAASTKQTSAAKSKSDPINFFSSISGQCDDVDGSAERSEEYQTGIEGGAKSAHVIRSLAATGS